VSIPTSFHLVNRTYIVEELSSEVASDCNMVGDCNREKARVRVQLDGSSDDNSEHTFYHELAHALLWATTKPKLSSDEAFVDSLGALLHQYMQTKKGTLKAAK
jgi:hypothetical protein